MNIKIRNAFTALSAANLALAAKEYGSGSSLDWATKDTALLSVRAVIVESYELIHRPSLIGMGVLQSAVILMGVDVIIRDTLLSSMHLAEQVLLSMELTEKNRPMQKSTFTVTILKRRINKVPIRATRKC